MGMYLCIRRFVRLRLQGRLGGVPGMANNNNGKSGLQIFEESKKLLYDSRGEVTNEAVWWGLDQALNDYRDAPNQQAREKAIAAVKAESDAVKENQEKKQQADEEESRWVGRIPAVTFLVIGGVILWFWCYMNSLFSNSGTTADARSLLKALVLGVSVCAALLSLLVIVLNGWKLFSSSERVKRFIDCALYSVSWAAALFSLIAIFFNSRI